MKNPYEAPTLEALKDVQLEAADKKEVAKHIEKAWETLKNESGYFYDLSVQDFKNNVDKFSRQDLDRMMVALGHIAKRLEGANPRTNYKEFENLLLELGLSGMLASLGRDTDNDRTNTFYTELTERTEALAQYVRDRKTTLLKRPS